MAFKLNTTRTVTKDVKLAITGENGDVANHTITATYRLLNKDELSQFDEKADKDLLDEVLVSVKGIELDEGASEADVLNACKNDVEVAFGLVMGFTKLLEASQKRVSSKA